MSTAEEKIKSIKSFSHALTICQDVHVGVNVAGSMLYASIDKTRLKLHLKDAPKNFVQWSCKKVDDDEFILCIHDDATLNGKIY